MTVIKYWRRAIVAILVAGAGLGCTQSRGHPTRGGGPEPTSAIIQRAGRAARGRPHVLGTPTAGKGIGETPSSGAPSRPVSDRRMIAAQSGEDLHTRCASRTPREAAARAREEALWKSSAGVARLRCAIASRSEPSPCCRERYHAAPETDRAVVAGHGDRGRRGPEPPFVDAATARRIEPLPLVPGRMAHDVTRHDIARGWATPAACSGTGPMIAEPLPGPAPRWTDQTPETWAARLLPTCGAWPRSPRSADRGGRHSVPLLWRGLGDRVVRALLWRARPHAARLSGVADSLEREKIEVCDRCTDTSRPSRLRPDPARAGALQDLATVVWTWPRRARLPDPVGDRSRSKSLSGGGSATAAVGDHSYAPHRPQNEV